MTPEQQLKEIIEAQVKGGCKSHAWFLQTGYTFVIAADGEIEWDNYDEETVGHILAILLDPSGLKAAYDSKPWHGGGFFSSDGTLDYSVSSDGLRSRHAAHQILELWISSEGNATAAIQTAFDLLPKKK